MFTPGHAETGGAARRSRMLAEGLASKGWTIRGLTRAGTLNRFQLIRTNRSLIIEVPGFGRRRTGAALFFLLAIPLGIIWGFRARAFLAVQLLSQTTAAGISSFITHRPLIAMAISSGELSEISYIRSTRLRRFRLSFLRRACSVVAQNDESRKELSEELGLEKVWKLRNPVEVAPLPPSDPRGVLYAGRFSSEKDLPGLLRAWKLVLEEVPAARLVLAGAGGAYRSVEEVLIRMVGEDPKLQASVTFPGWVSDVRSLFAQNEIFVFPSHSEGMSNALLEACAALRTVVASDIAPNVEVLGSSYPLLFRTGDVQDLAAAIIRAIQNDDVRSLARTIIEKRIALFSKEVVVEELAAGIERCING